jgi:hypothetical protein
MKTTINTAIFLLLGVCALSFGVSRPHAFEIYLVNKDNADLQRIELHQEPIISEADIIKYDWDKHEILLSNDGFNRIPNVRDVGVHGKLFVLIANGTRCYKGAFWTNLSSVSYPNPIINVGPQIDKRPKNVIRIERAYPSEQSAAGADPRNNELIYKALSELKKIESTK